MISKETCREAEELMAKLTPREREVIVLSAKGLSTKVVASMLDIGWFTAQGHMKAAYRKLEVTTRQEAAVLAAKAGLV